MNEIQVVAVIVSAVATGVIAYYAYRSHELSKAVRDLQAAQAERQTAKEEEFRQRLEDLYRGMMVAIFIGSMGATPAYSTMENKIREFSKHYRGKTEIF